MPGRDSPAHQASIDRFWANYPFILKKNNLPASFIPGYRNHVEACRTCHFVRALSLMQNLISLGGTPRCLQRSIE